MGEGEFGLGCDNMVDHPFARPAEADSSPYCCFAVAAVGLAEGLEIASMAETEIQHCRSGLRDMIRGLGSWSWGEDN